MDTSGWKIININSIFDISYGNKLDMCQMTVKKGGIPFVTRTATNNGVGDYVEELDSTKPYPANCLTIALGGSIGSTFLQKEPFYTSQNVAVMKPKEKLSEGVLLFLATIIEKECNKRFVAFGRELNKHIKRDFTIKLPLNADETPDWDKIHRLVNSITPKLPARSRSVWDKTFDKSPINKENISLKDRSWQWFRIKNLYNVKPGHYYYPSEYEDGKTPYCSASAQKNGISKYIDLEPDFDGNQIITGKVGCTTFYQPKPFSATSDVNVLVAKSDTKMNTYIGLFVTTIINFNENYKWNYGRQCRKNDTENIRIKLPVDAAGNPDWQFMEDYIKSLPYSANL